MPTNRPAIFASLAAMLILSLPLETLAGDPPPPQETPQKTSNERLADTVKDAVKDALDGTLKDKVTETLKDKVTETLKGALTGPSDDDSKETAVVLRISKEFVRQHAAPAVEHVAPVDKCLFGSRVTGTAFTRGQPLLTMAADHSKSEFTLHFTGTTTTRTVAVKHPVKAYNIGAAVFDVHRQISFDGMQFIEGPESIEASYSSKLNGLSTPPGLRGRIVRRLALPKIEALKPRADAVALADTKANVLEAFGKHTDELVSDLNARLPWKQTVSLLLPQATQWVGHFASTKDWILASPGPKDAEIPQLPEESARMQAPIELWVHGKPGEVSAAKVVAIWSAVHVGLNQFRKTSTSVAERIQDIKPVMIDDWWVIHVGADLIDELTDQLKQDEKGS